MKKALKWIGIILGGLIVLVLMAIVGLNVVGASRLNETVDVQAERIVIPMDDAALARGEHLVPLCQDCHGGDLSGQPVANDPALGSIYSTNITGLADTHSDDDLVRAIRHAVGKDGRQLMIMPAESFIHFSEKDLGAIIAYLKTIPRTGDDVPEPQLRPIGRALLGAGMLDLFPASYIDHDMPFPEMPEVGANLAYGEYFSHFCQSCHGPDLAGGKPTDPASPPAPNLTPSGELGGWTEEDFLATMRTGLTVSGQQLNPAFMPWASFSKLDDDELRAMWMYLESLPAVETAVE
jgi:mono/diheme cytochrome c family protein